MKEKRINILHTVGLTIIERRRIVTKSLHSASFILVVLMLQVCNRYCFNNFFQLKPKLVNYFARVFCEFKT